MSMDSAPAGTWRRRGDQALRLITAMPLGYAVATLWAMALSRILPMRPDEATGGGMLVAFVLCAVIAMWAYAAASGWRAFRLVLIAGLIAAAIAWIAVATGGRA
ncbi:hypothetical protein M9978_10670 [Sphingomonas sp. MG17]|uniref:Iron uptake protein n=1 Tax=Sphingomonas tagetis TaxID=2949092 RepID=A0A9X2HJ10_9SPHN|nr:hypothetical protein [Sphingomonas tagetis]MCP3730892.1 hypothetical protein [Sphingomonas tagetis]